MNVLFHVGYPLAWAPGGHAIQIRSTFRELAKAGVAVSWLHHEEENLPPADVIHYWGAPPSLQHLQLAQRQKSRIVCSAMVALAANRSSFLQAGSTLLRRALSACLRGRYHRFIPQSLYAKCDGIILLSAVERDYLVKVWNVPRERTSVIPNGVDEAFRNRQIQPLPFDGLLYAGHICDVKNSVELAAAAQAAQVPIRFVGSARVDGEEYIQRFRSLVDGQWVQWRNEVLRPEELAAHFKGAKGVVLASKYEGYPLVALEALACERPLLLPDLPNMKSLFGASAQYAPPPSSPAFVAHLRRFWERACSGERAPVFRVPSWADVAAQIHDVYRQILKT